MLAMALDSLGYAMAGPELATPNGNVPTATW